MKQLVLLGEGHGENHALPLLVRKILRERSGPNPLPLCGDVIRTKFPRCWDREKGVADYSEWQRRIELAGKRAMGGGVLAVFDGDMPEFPPGSRASFCAASAAKALATAAKNSGAGTIFSLAVVFACVEYETWIIAGVEALAGKALPDGRVGLPAGIKFPGGDPESHGKGWLIRNCPGYRETIHQKEFTELLDLNMVRAKKLRSFTRLETAITQLIKAAETHTFVATPE